MSYFKSPVEDTRHNHDSEEDTGEPPAAKKKIGTCNDNWKPT